MVWLATDDLRITASGAFYDSELTSVFADYNDDGSIKRVKAPAGTSLPQTPDFKGNVVARYEFPLGDFSAYVQGALTYSGERRSALIVEDYEAAGDFPSLTFLDLAAGIRKESYAVDLFIRNATNEDTPWYSRAQCNSSVCLQRYVIRERPITFVVQVHEGFRLLTRSRLVTARLQPGFLAGLQSTASQALAHLKRPTAFCEAGAVLRTVLIA